MYTNSRYATGLVVKAHDARKDNYALSIFRQFPTINSSFFLYIWTENDRIDKIALKFLGDPENWWKIMDINPEIINPFSISVGTTVRIPNGTENR
jgi:hypothetical protein